MPLSSARTDRELLVAVQQHGDTAALGLLFTRHHGRLFSFLARWTGDNHAAEDLVQEMFLRLLRPSGGNTIAGEVLPWLIMVARNMAIDRYRTQHQESSLDSDPPLADDRPLTLDRLTLEERSRQIEELLTALPMTHREVLLLRGVEGLDHREIGLVLNCSEGAARVRLHRATTAFRHLWHARHGDE